ncbi:MAG: cation diffusion facilitator family transporter [Bacillota bacterium]
MEQKVNVAGISIIISIALSAGKIVAGLAMNSASVFAGGIHSCLDLLAAFLSYSSVNQTKKPADEDHRYGHGKYENIAAITEAFFIFLAAVLILYKTVPGMVTGTSGIMYHDLGIAVMGVSAVVNLLVSAMLAGAYRRTSSPAFRSDRRHLLVNAGTSLAICIGLIIIKYKGITVLDQIMALAVTVVLLFEGYGHLRKSAGSLVDVRLSEEEEDIIKKVLAGHGEKYVQYHALRTRRSGPYCYVDLHMVVPRDQVISITHQLCDRIEKDIREKLPGVNVLIHAEPCRPVSGECRNCGIEKKLHRDDSGSARCTAKPGTGS